MNRIVIALVLTICVAISSVEHAWSAQFTDLGFLTNPNGEFFATAISADGKVVSGYTNPSSHSENGIQPFRWSQHSGMVALGLPPGVTYAFSNGMSADASILVGYALYPAGIRAFRWSSTTGITQFAPLMNNSLQLEQASDVSGDGSIATGIAFGNAGRFAVRWPATGNANLLGPYPNDFAGGSPNAISADGLVIAGRMSGYSQSQAFRWSQIEGVVGLGDLPGITQFSSYASDVSADGSVIVGAGNTSHLPKAFRWTSATGIVSLGALLGPEFSSEANAVSRDGSTIVGDSANEPFIWTQQEGMRSITDLLVAQGIDLTGWRLFTATAVSDNGKFVAGWGFDPNGQTRAWLADLTISVPEPSTISLVAISMICLRHFTRRR